MTIKTVYDLHDKQIRSYALQKFGAIGEDYLQEVYIKLSNYSCEKIKQISDKGYLLFLLFNMLRQQHISDIRKHKEIKPDELLITFENTTLEIEIDRNKLDEVQAIFLEYYENGFSMLKISEIFDLDYKTVTKKFKSIPIKDA